MDQIFIKVSKEGINHYGHIDHSWYPTFFEDAQSKFLVHRHATFDDLENLYNLRCVQRSLTIEYIRPLFLDDEIIVSTMIEMVGNTSFTFHQIIERAGVGVTTCRTVYVVVDQDTRKQSIPVAVKKRLQIQI